MRCLWWVASLLVGIGCSDGSVRSGNLPEPADFLPMAADTADSTSAVLAGDTLGTASGDQPHLVFRCEEGRLDAYLIIGTPAEVESGRLDDQAVPVRLDSTPSC